MSLTIKVSCHKCETEIDLETEAIISCELCDENMTSPGEVKGALKYASDDFENYLIDLTNPKLELGASYLYSTKEKDAYEQGIKRGFQAALCWIADYFGDEMVDFFENEIEPKIRGNKEEDHEVV